MTPGDFGQTPSPESAPTSHHNEHPGEYFYLLCRVPRGGLRPWGVGDLVEGDCPIGRLAAGALTRGGGVRCLRECLGGGAMPLLHQF